MQVAGRTQALLEHRLHLSSLPPADAAAALLLRGLMELCVYPPQPLEGGGSSGGGGGDGSPAGDADTSGSGTSGGRAGGGGTAGGGSGGAAASEGQGAEAGVGSTGRLPMSWSCTDEAVLQVCV